VIRVCRAIIRDRRLSFVLRMLVGMTLVLASVDKLFDARGFADAVAAYELVPRILVNLVAIALPWLELLTGVALLTGFGARAAGLVATLLATVYAVAVVSALARGMEISCGCFGDGGAALDRGDVWLRVGLLAAGLQITIAERALGWPATAGTRFLAGRRRRSQQR
jgi:uncharacterized membrane protein YphA (DoxX/SURF4 family)